MEKDLPDLPDWNGGILYICEARQSLKKSLALR
jgi:hypothetical protein